LPDCYLLLTPHGGLGTISGLPEGAQGGEAFNSTR